MQKKSENIVKNVISCGNNLNCKRVSFRGFNAMKYKHKIIQIVENVTCIANYAIVFISLKVKEKN